MKPVVKVIVKNILIFLFIVVTFLIAIGFVYLFK